MSIFDFRYTIQGDCRQNDQIASGAARHKVDNEGNRIGPLPPYIDGKAKKTTKGKGNKGEIRISISS